MQIADWLMLIQFESGVWQCRFDGVFASDGDDCE